MKITPQQWTIGSVLAAIAAMVAIWNTVDPWPTIGWTTPEQHAADIVALEEGHTASEQSIKEFRDEWKCDEYVEELEELLEKQDAGDTSAILQDKIDRLKDKIDKLKCYSRFDD